MTTQSISEADKVAAAGFSEVYTPVKPYLDSLDVFLLEQVLNINGKSHLIMKTMKI